MARKCDVLRKQWTPLRACLLACFVGLFIWGTPNAAFANAFSISGVAVDVTSDSPTTARQQAMLQGEVAAFNRLLSNVISPEDRALVPELTPADVEALVADFSVSNEKTSATRYIANMTVTFDEGRVARFLQNFGIELVKGGEKTVVFLGVYKSDPEAEPLLWEDDNPWRMLLNQTAVSRGLFPVAVPLGDMLDTLQVPADRALTLDQEAMDSLLQRYGADEVVVAEVVTTADQGSKLTLKRYPQPLDASLSTSKTPVNEDLAAALNDLASKAVLSVAQGAKSQRKGVMIGETESLAILVPVRAIRDWVRVDTNLRALPSVKSVMLRATRTDIVQAAVQYSGTDTELRNTMERLGFGVTEYDGYWEVTPYPQATTTIVQ